MKVIFVILLSLVFICIGQILFKIGTNTVNIELTYNGVVGMIHSTIPLGIICYVFSLYLWLKALQEVELSTLFPLYALNFVLISLAGFFIFHENFSAAKIIGIVIIIIGVLILSRGI